MEFELFNQSRYFCKTMWNNKHLAAHIRTAQYLQHTNISYIVTIQLWYQICQSRSTFQNNIKHTQQLSYLLSVPGLQ
jgi:hypothetical protein